MAKENKYCQLWLTSANTVEADTIVKTLLDKRLIACARQFSVNSNYRWQGKIDNANEVLIMMESRLDLFERVESVIKKLHSYETFVLEAVVVDKLSRSAEDWFSENLKGNN